MAAVVLVLGHAAPCGRWARRRPRASAFVRVAGLVAPPQALLRPSIAVRVLRASRHPATGIAASSNRDAVRAAQTLADNGDGSP